MNYELRNNVGFTEMKAWIEATHQHAKDMGACNIRFSVEATANIPGSVSEKAHYEVLFGLNDAPLDSAALTGKVGRQAVVASTEELKRELIRRAADRFWSKVDKQLGCKVDGGCWVWNGQTDKNGSPIYRVKFKGKEYKLSAARAAYNYEFTDKPAPVGKNVARTCGNPLCVSPYHGIVGKRGAPRKKPVAPAPVPIPEPPRENVVLAVVRGLSGRIRSIIPVRQTL
jgi:hypothetical protein